MQRKCLETDIVYITQRIHDINWEKNIKHAKTRYADRREDK